MSTLKIFSDRGYLLPGQPHAVMLNPFWGNSARGVADPLDLFPGRYDKYAEMGSRLLEMVALSEADVAVLPSEWRWVLTSKEATKLAVEFAEQAARAGKPLVVFYESDTDEPVPMDNSFVFRTSLRRSQRRSNEFAQPAWCEDIPQSHFGSEVPLRIKQTRATVGFCGRASVPRAKLRVWGGHLLEFADGTLGTGHGFRPLQGIHLRKRAMRILSTSPLVKTEFVVRNGFMGGAYSGIGSDATIDRGRLRLARQEYVRNIADSDYVLCVRGGGNFSYRLYETLCCGRIPLFVDTDCVLPYDSLINWKEYTVWVDCKNLARIDERVAAFHESLSPQDFQDLQLRCRRLWEEWLSPQGFFANFRRHFQRGVR